ncbi:MAG: nucleotidyltransferase family protein [Bacteroidaceae bacterium]|nr:nucleotidyltransferase family protein [Bacteroidaceae bacterium]
MDIRNALTREERALMALVRAGLWEREADDLSPFPLTDSQWGTVMRKAAEQTVTGLTFRGLHHLPADMMPGDIATMRWAAAANGIRKANRRMDNAVASLFGAMHAAGLRPLLLKGQAVARMYEHPDLRQCGDMDIYLASEAEHRAAIGMVEKQGIAVSRMADGAYTYEWEGVEVEQHTAVFDLCNPFSQRFLTTLTSGAGSADEITIEATSGRASVATTSPIATLLLLDSHILKHAMGHGIGLRQFCDIARAYHTLAGGYDQERLADAYRRTGLTRWTRRLHAFLTELLGMDPDRLPCLGATSTTPPALLRMVTEGGNFGHHGATRAPGDQPAWQRKAATAGALLRNSRLTMSLAPAETIFNALHLMRGNL